MKKILFGMAVGLPMGILIGRIISTAVVLKVLDEVSKELLASKEWTEFVEDNPMSTDSYDYVTID